MERVAFLLAETGDRLSALLNPESLVVQRLAGIKPRRSLGNGLLGTGLVDDALLYTGGGRTELRLELLFDVSVEGSSVPSEDVRDLTAPFWELAENANESAPSGAVPLVWFVWGKRWSIPGVVAAVSERLEDFTPDGTPRRSWMRMRLLRVISPQSPQPDPLVSPMADLPPLSPPTTATPSPSTVEGQVYQVTGTRDRLDTLSQQYYNAPGLWRWIATYNNVDDPLHLAPGQVLRIPPSR